MQFLLIYLITGIVVVLAMHKVIVDSYKNLMHVTLTDKQRNAIEKLHAITNDLYSKGLYYIFMCYSIFLWPVVILAIIVSSAKKGNG
jgi:hypothetical protein